jgi:hypothetical protein
MHQISFMLLLFSVLCQTVAAGSTEKSGNPELFAAIPQTGQTVNFAPVPKTGRTKVDWPGDDGDLQMGVQWPDPRFTDNGDGTVSDNLTGLIWLKQADCFPMFGYKQALEASNALEHGQCGLNDESAPGDWRLPNIRELLSLIDYGQGSISYDYAAIPYPNPFTGVQTDSDYWSSTGMSSWTLVAIWTIDIWTGRTYQVSNYATLNAWPVRESILSIKTILDFFDESVEAGTIEGLGRGRLTNVKLFLMREMLETAGWLIEKDKIKAACFTLQRAYKRCDGKRRPQRDFVVGDAVQELADMVKELKGELGCK